MADACTEFLEELGRRGHEPLLGGTTGRVRLDLAHDGETEHWLVAIAAGDVAVSMVPHDDTSADTVIRLERSVFEGMADGRVNSLAALLRGEVAVEGNLHLLWLFQRIFPGPPSSRDRAGTAGSGGATP